ncbi:MAG: hypothetical protein IKG69_00480 [Atopobiaceae bacterium]|nr:hypothetical protein [Atopobiaceae bacterium]
MSCGEMTDHDRRVWHHMYETCETPAEHAERIVRLEELVADALANLRNRDCVLEIIGPGLSPAQAEETASIERRARGLGIEVG